jgi:hypothetical protein
MKKLIKDNFKLIEAIGILLMAFSIGALFGVFASIVAN